MRDEEEMRFASAQAGLFDTAARCMRRPDAGLAAEIIAGSLTRRFGMLRSSSDPRVAQALEELTSFERACSSDEPGTLRLRLEVEYNRLFVGPAALPAPPYESYYASEARVSGGGRLRGEEERAVLRAYGQRGFAVSEELSELPDHIALELEFLYLVSSDEAHAWSRGDAALAMELQEAQASFIRNHVGRWVGHLSERAREAARTPFYPAVLDLATSFCA